MKVSSFIFVFLLLPRGSAAATIAIELQEQVGRSCLECHQGDKPAGNLDLSKLGLELNDEKAFETWVRVHDRVQSGEMPPDSESMQDETRVAFLRNLSEQLHETDLARVIAKGRGPARRMTREEYQSNLRDLLQLPDLDIQDLLPEDRVKDHTNKVEETLDLTRVQLQSYLLAAQTALDQAIAAGPQPRPTNRYFALATRMFPKAIDHAGRESSFFALNSQMVPLTANDLRDLNQKNEHDQGMEIAIFRSAAWPYYGYPNDFVAKEAGRYDVRFSARAVRQLRDFRLIPSAVAQPMTFRARKPSQADVTGDVRATGGTIDIEPVERVYATSVFLNEGETIEYSLLGLPVPHPITSHGGPLYYDFPPMPEGGHPGIAFRWIEINGPIEEKMWPPRSHQVLFGELPIEAVAKSGDEQAPSQRDDSDRRVRVISNDEPHDAKRLLRRFASNAARRSVGPQELVSFEKLVFERLQAGDSFTDAMLIGFQAYLCSTSFLFLEDPTSVPASQTERLQQAVANRLSHFLWNTRPDAALKQVALDNRLLEPNVLREQTERLLKDDRFDAFIVNFTDYWLDLKQLLRDDPDIRLYPEYRGDDYLTESMGRETREFVKLVFQDNLPIATLVDSDFAMLNDRLAKHYELPAIEGSRPRKVALPSASPRGGLLTQGAILKVTANGTTTSPVKRGAWMMDRILGSPPPPPPPGIPAVEPDLRGAKTIREIMSAHTTDAVCAGCHRQFDPLGFALENFDVMGAWRTRYRSLQRGDEVTGIDRAGHKYVYHVASAVEADGETVDGDRFRGIKELKQLLLRDQRRLARNLLKRLLSYATGTPERFSDRNEIENILDKCAEQGYRVGDLTHGLIQSRLFVGGGNES